MIWSPKHNFLWKPRWTVSFLVIVIAPFPLKTTKNHKCTTYIQWIGYQVDLGSLELFSQECHSCKLQDPLSKVLLILVLTLHHWWLSCDLIKIIMKVEPIQGCTITIILAAQYRCSFLKEPNNFTVGSKYPHVLWPFDREVRKILKELNTYIPSQRISWCPLTLLQYKKKTKWWNMRRGCRHPVPALYIVGYI